MLSNYPVINMKATGENIARLRKSKGLKVKDIQDIFGFEQPQAIYKWQWGENLPTIDNLLVLSAIFNTSIENILVTDCSQDVSLYLSVFLKHDFTFSYLIFIDEIAYSETSTGILSCFAMFLISSKVLFGILGNESVKL